MLLTNPIPKASATSRFSNGFKLFVRHGKCQPSPILKAFCFTQPMAAIRPSRSSKHIPSIETRQVSKFLSICRLFQILLSAPRLRSMMSNFDKMDSCLLAHALQISKTLDYSGDQPSNQFLSAALTSPTPSQKKTPGSLIPIPIPKTK